MVQHMENDKIKICCPYCGCEQRVDLQVCLSTMHIIIKCEEMAPPLNGCGRKYVLEYSYGLIKSKKFILQELKDVDLFMQKQLK